MVVPLPRTKLVPDNALMTPEVLISVPVVNPDKVSAGVVTVPVNVGEATVANVACVIVEPLARTKLVPDKVLTTPEVFINVPVVNPLSVSAGVVTVPVNVGEAVSE
jgi:hypothetical protein